jgi:hypothetical protein
MTPIQFLSTNGFEGKGYGCLSSTIVWLCVRASIYSDTSICRLALRRLCSAVSRTMFGGFTDPTPFPTLQMEYKSNWAPTAVSFQDIMMPLDVESFWRKKGIDPNSRITASERAAQRRLWSESDDNLICEQYRKIRCVARGGTTTRGVTRCIQRM